MEKKLTHKSENRQKCVDILLITSLDEFLKQTEYIITHVSMYTFFKCSDLPNVLSFFVYKNT